MNYHAMARDPIVISVTETSQVGEARRAASVLTRSIGLDDVVAGQAAIVVTELANNLVRHAKSGELIMRSMNANHGRTATGLEVLAVDRGPGIANVSQALVDGFSTGSTPGTGLGAVKRLSTYFEVFSEPSRGTVVLAQFQPQASAPAAKAMGIGAVCLPKEGEDVCGDAWAAEANSSGRVVVIVADGLGHGEDAAVASSLAIRIFRENTRLSAPQIVTAIHAALRSTRGAAVAIAEILQNQQQVVFVGVGNIGAMVIDGASVRSMISHNGTAGVEARKIQSFNYPWSRDSLLVMHSDGLSGHWSLTQYPGLRYKHPSLIAGTLYRDFRRQRDDVTVLAAGERTI